MKKIAAFIIIIIIILPVLGNAQIISTIAGTGTNACTDNGIPATSATITDPLGCTFDQNGTFYFCNQQCGTVCEIDSAGIITVIAGPGAFHVTADGGPATAAYLAPNNIVFDTAGNLYISDAGNYRIRKVNMVTGIISTIAGTGTIGFGGDGGPATAALIGGATGLCFDRYGNLYLSDAGNNRIRKINTMGVITTIAGTGVTGFYGDGGPATAAKLFDPYNLAIDTIGNLYFPDGDNYRVRKIDTSGVITTIAGTGTVGYNGDGIPATDADFNPYKIALDSFGNIYLADSNRIRRIDVNGIIHTLTGTSVGGYNGDGIAADTAEIYEPSGIATDACGNVYFGDVENSRVRKVTFPAVPTITLSAVPAAVAGTSVTITATISNPANYVITWKNHGVVFATTTVPSVTYTKTASIDTITATGVPTDGCWDSASSTAVVVSYSEGVPPLSVRGEVIVFPNPVSSTLNITMYAAPIMQATAIMQATVSNVFGQVVMDEVFNADKVQIDVSGLPAGIYFVQVNGIYIQKFIKE